MHALIRDRGRSALALLLGGLLLASAAEGAEPGAAKETLVRYVNTNQVKLVYEVKGEGAPDGGGVFAWVTEDGKTWRLTQVKAVERSRVVVEVPRDGRYGFTVQVGNRPSKSSPPSAETTPFWVEVDTTPPSADLYAPSKGPNAGEVVFEWVARDRSLGDKPVSLLWAEEKCGPWHEIATGLPDRGHHVWKPRVLPANAHLRLVVEDRAGNKATAETDRPVLLDFSQPEAVIKKAEPVK